MCWIAFVENDVCVVAYCNANGKDRFSSVISGTNDAFFSINDQDAALDILMGSLSTGDILISVEEPEGGKLHTANPTIA